jgi:hypothetical protein
MAQKVSVALDDDLTSGPAEQTVRFASCQASIRAPLAADRPSRAEPGTRRHASASWHGGSRGPRAKD